MISTLPSDSAHTLSSGPQYPVRERKAGSGRILIVEDDQVLSRFLHRILTAEAFEVESAFNGPDALESLRPELDLLILDLNLPEIDGITVLRRLRPQFPNLPVLVLTGRSRTESTVAALESGADDCLVKPFSYVELIARVRALLRRTATPSTKMNRCSDLTLDREEMRVERAGRRLEFTPREYNLLEFLMRSPRIPVARSVLLQEVWGAGFDPSTNVVDVYMKYVRDKVDLPGMPKLIRTVRGIGYVVSED